MNRISQQLEQNEKTNNEIENDIIEMSANVEEAKSMLVNFNSTVSTNQQSDSSFKNVSDEVIRKVEKNIVNQFNNLANKVKKKFFVFYCPFPSRNNFFFDPSSYQTCTTKCQKKSKEMKTCCETQ